MSRAQQFLNPLKGGSVPLSYTARLLSYSPIAYWVLGEAAGAIAADQVDSPAQDGAYTAVTLGQAGIGDGHTCPLFDGSTSVIDAFSATLAGVYSGAEMTVLAWVKPANAAVWGDSTNRMITQALDDANNRVYLQTGGANTFGFVTRGGGTWTTINVTSSAWGDSWQMLALTRSESAGANGEVRAYRYVGGVGGQVGSTGTSLGTYVGPTTTMFIWASNGVPNSVWSGWIAHFALWASVLTEPQLAALAEV